jgi:heme oxygenase
MSLKELTADLHEQAEQTRFMQAIIKRSLPPEVWTNFIYQKFLFYKTIEGLAGAYCGCNVEPEIYRTFYLYQDFLELKTNGEYRFCPATLEYNQYLSSVPKDPEYIIPHLYVWHMGDFYGGQMIKRLTPGSNLALTFENKDRLVALIRSKCRDGMATEAGIAFQYAIKIMNQLF